jgi:hypothetical protein
VSTLARAWWSCRAASELDELLTGTARAAAAYFLRQRGRDLDEVMPATRRCRRR